MRQRGDDTPSAFGGMFMMLVMAGIALVIGLIIYAVCTQQIDANERGVKTRWGVIQNCVEPGLAWVNPMVEKITEYKVDNERLSNFKTPLNTYTIDNQEINATYELIYRLPVKCDDLIYIQTNAQNYAAQLHGSITNIMKIVLGKANANSLASHRDEIVTDIKDRLIKDLMDIYRITAIDFRLLNVDYTESFRNAVNGAAAAKAKIEQEENIRLQEEKIAEQKRVRARGDADALITAKTAEATGKELVGKAEATAIDARGKALSANQAALVEYEKAQRWTGVLPQWMGGGPVPFMSIDKGELKK